MFAFNALHSMPSKFRSKFPTSHHTFESNLRVALDPFEAYCYLYWCHCWSWWAIILIDSRWKVANVDVWENKYLIDGFSATLSHMRRCQEISPSNASILESHEKSIKIVINFAKTLFSKGKKVFHSSSPCSATCCGTQVMWTLKPIYKM